jgi:hypothetical protein
VKKFSRAARNCPTVTTKNNRYNFLEIFLQTKKLKYFDE